MYMSEVSRALRLLGLKTVDLLTYDHKRRLTLKQWMADTAGEREGRTFIVLITRHFVTVSGDTIADNQQGFRGVETSKHRRKHIQQIVEVTK